MNVPFLSLRDVTAMHAVEIKEAVNRIIDSGWYLQGKENEAFEQHYAEYIGAIHTQVRKRPLVMEKERINFDV